jgi:ketosteroid isomerase-like protein
MVFDDRRSPAPTQEAMMRRLTHVPLLLVTLGTPVLLGAQARVATTAKSGGDARSAIEAANAGFTESFNKGDVAAAASIYDADATLLPPNLAAISGQPAIADYWQGGWKAGVRNVKLTTSEVSTHGNEASEVGTYQMEVQSPDGAVVAHDHGKYIVLWKRDAKGQWKWHRDIWNSDVPATPAPSADSAPAAKP